LTVVNASKVPQTHCRKVEDKVVWEKALRMHPSAEMDQISWPMGRPWRTSRSAAAVRDLDGWKTVFGTEPIALGPAVDQLDSAACRVTA
jgi:hypothetical protein